MIKYPYPRDWPPALCLELIPVNGSRGDARLTFDGRFVDDLARVLEQFDVAGHGVARRGKAGPGSAGLGEAGQGD